MECMSKCLRLSFFHTSIRFLAALAILVTGTSTLFGMPIQEETVAPPSAASTPPAAAAPKADDPPPPSVQPREYCFIAHCTMGGMGGSGGTMHIISVIALSQPEGQQKAELKAQELMPNCNPTLIFVIHVDCPNGPMAFSARQRPNNDTEVPAEVISGPTWTVECSGWICYEGQWRRLVRQETAPCYCDAYRSAKAMIVFVGNQFGGARNCSCCVVSRPCQCCH